MHIQTPKGLRKIGPDQPTFIVAEMSGNHNQNLGRALELVDAAAKSGVDAIKLQTYTPDTMTIPCDNEYFQITVNDAWKGQTLYDLYGKAYTPWEWQEQIMKRAKAAGLVCFSTPFDSTAVDFLEQLDVPLYKVASFETGDLELLRHIGRTHKPVIISRGMTSLDTLQEALSALNDAGCPETAVLHCVSAYPAKAENMNLSTIPDLAKRFGVTVGLSDHTLGTTAAIAAVALGARIVEKHFTLRRSDGGPDAAFSLEPHELTALVKEIRTAEGAIGSPTYDVTEDETENVTFRRSLFAVKDIKQGETVMRDNVRCIRPGHGLAPKHLPEILGKTAACYIPYGTPITWEKIQL